MAGSNVILDWGFWNREEREQVSEHYKKQHILYEWHYIGLKNNIIRKIYVKTSVTNKPAICFWIMQNYKFEARMLDFSLKSYDDYLIKEI